MDNGFRGADWNRARQQMHRILSAHPSIEHDGEPGVHCAFENSNPLSLDPRGGCPITIGSSAMIRRGRPRLVADGANAIGEHWRFPALAWCPWIFERGIQVSA
jgi:hypothetical protein